MNPMRVVVGLESVQLSHEIGGIPEKGAIEELTPDCPDQAFDEGMGYRGVGDGRQPGRTHGSGAIGAAVLRQHPANDIPIEVDTKRISQLLGNAQMAESWITCLEFNAGGDEL